MGKSLNVLSDMLRNPSLTFTRATLKRGVDRRSARKDLGSALGKDHSGRIKARRSDRIRFTLHIPSVIPDVPIPVSTKNYRERQLVGQWMDALNDAGRDDFSKIDRFPRGQVIGGVRLPTSRDEIQRILDAMAETENPFEGLYRSLARA
jgi:hypothetical protein